MTQLLWKKVKVITTDLILSFNGTMLIYDTIYDDFFPNEIINIIMFVKSLDSPTSN